jgi:hypothetical protein
MNRLRLLVSDTKMQMVQSAQSVEKCVNFDEAEFVFDNTWDGFDKIAVFWRGNESYRVPLMESDTCKIPWEILRNKGVFYIGCIGTKADGTTVTTRAPVSHVVAAGAMRDGTAPSEPTPSRGIPTRSWRHRIADASSPPSASWCSPSLRCWR